MWLEERVTIGAFRADGEEGKRMESDTDPQKRTARESLFPQPKLRHHARVAVAMRDPQDSEPRTSAPPPDPFLASSPRFDVRPLGLPYLADGPSDRNDFPGPFRFIDA